MGTPDRKYWLAASMQLNCWWRLRGSDWPTKGTAVLPEGLLEAEDVEGEGEEVGGPGEGWGTERPGCSGGGGGAGVTTPPMTPALPPLLLPPKSKRPIPEWSCSWASAASAG